MPVPLFRAASRLPLPLLHGIGYLLGLGGYLLAGEYRRTLADNLRASGLPGATGRRLRWQAAMEAGAGLTELARIWGRPYTVVARHIHAVEGWEAVEAIQATGQGIILLSPHLGCFEILGQFVGARRPITALYRPPRQAALEPLMLAARGQGLASLAPTSLAGVRALLKALKRGEIVGILPDQVPPEGEGAWVDFFGRPAYTMTLVSKLHAATGARVVVGWAERRPWGRGYILRFSPLPEGPDALQPERMNRYLAALIAQAPAQYTWSYKRYKKPRARDAAIR